jgi:release factor glutamine methyltransferase
LISDRTDSAANGERPADLADAEPRDAGDRHDTIGQVIAAGTDALRAAGSPTPRLDAEVLLAHAIGRDRSWLMAHPEEPVDARAVERLIERRAGGEPVAYIRGFKEWHSLRIRTDQRALIPRPETELLADAAVGEIEEWRARGPVVGWEVATGSGAVAIVLAQHFGASEDVTLIATDISADALDLARENLVDHGVADAVLLREADLLAPAGSDIAKPDVVVANLPYVASAEVDARAGSLGFEPRIALDGGPDGLAVLRRLFEQLPRATRPGATILLELGIDQVTAVRALAPAGAAVTVVPDLAGLDRVIRIQMPEDSA